MRLILLVASLALVAFSAPAASETLRVVGWNTESGDADPELLAELIEAADDVSLWGFSEVLSDWAPRFRRAAEHTGASFGSVLGTTGRADRLLVVYDTARLEAVSHTELHDINVQRRVRSPLVVQFRDRASGLEFLFMVNHLYRSRPGRRLEQSRALRVWAARQTLPVIAVGDYNYDWHFERGEAEHDAGYDELVKDDVFVWVRPEVLVPTQCSRHKSVLDFVFASGAARDWAPRSHILEAQADYCPDDERHSDHRPVLAEFDLEIGRRLALRKLSLERIGSREVVRVARRSRQRPHTGIDASELPAHDDPELKVSVQRVLGSLQPEQRAILVLRDVEGLSESEAAAELGVAKGTAKSRWSSERSMRRQTVCGRSRETWRALCRTTARGGST